MHARDALVDLKRHISVSGVLLLFPGDIITVSGVFQHIKFMKKPQAKRSLRFKRTLEDLAALNKKF